MARFRCLDIGFMPEDAELLEALDLLGADVATDGVGRWDRRLRRWNCPICRHGHLLRIRTLERQAD